MYASPSRHRCGGINLPLAAWNTPGSVDGKADLLCRSTPFPSQAHLLLQLSSSPQIPVPRVTTGALPGFGDANSVPDIRERKQHSKPNLPPQCLKPRPFNPYAPPPCASKWLRPAPNPSPILPPGVISLDESCIFSALRAIADYFTHALCSTLGAPTSTRAPLDALPSLRGRSYILAFSFVRSEQVPACLASVGPQTGGQHMLLLHSALLPTYLGTGRVHHAFPWPLQQSNMHVHHPHIQRWGRKRGGSRRLLVTLMMAPLGRPPEPSC